MFEKLRNRIKEWVISKTITHAEARFSIFVWMRQINERILRIEDKEIEAVIQLRAEQEAFYDAKMQKLELRLGMLESQMSHVETVVMAAAEETKAALEELKSDV